MKSNKTNKKSGDEVEVGDLFRSIGKGFSNIISFIIETTKLAFNILIGYAVFIRRKLSYFIAAVLVGGVLGVITDTIVPTTFIGSATLQPRFDSSRQLYNNAEYLNDLASQGDSVQLAIFFNINQGKASKIKSIKMSPFVSEVTLLMEYNNYVTELDSIVAAETSFREFKKQLQVFDRDTHTLTVESTSQDIFPSLLEPFISSVSEEEYFKTRQETELQNLSINDSITTLSITQTDSLLSLFEEVRLIEAKKEFSNGTNLYMSNINDNNAEISLLDRKIALTERLEKIRQNKIEAKKEFSNGTNLYMSNISDNNAEILLLDRKIALTERLEKIRQNKIEAINVVDVVSPFPKLGYQDSSLLKNNKIRGLLLGFFLVNLIFGLKYFDQFIMSNAKK